MPLYFAAERPVVAREGGLESRARTVEEIIVELLLARTSERQGRLIDIDISASMENKKQEGYF